MGCILSTRGRAPASSHRVESRHQEPPHRSEESPAVSQDFGTLPERVGSPLTVRPYRAAIGAALKRPGRTVCIDLQCPRPAGALTEDNRSTSDGRIAITSVRSGNSTRLEIASSVYGMPALGTYETEGSLSELRSNAADSLAASLSGLNASSPRRPSREGAPRLPGPPDVTQLSERQIELIGVARWPTEGFNNEDAASNRYYGRRFYATSREAASRIANGNISSWRQLWQFAAGARHEWAAEGGHQGEASRTSLFAGGYPRDRDEHSTPMEGRYRYVAERIMQWYHHLPIEHNNLLSIIPNAGQLPEDFMSHRVFVAQDELQGAPISLTRLMVPNGAMASFLSPIAQDLQQRQYSRAFPLMMEHTHPDLIQPITNHVEQLFSGLLERRPAPEGVLTTLGEMHWWMAHAMPDIRGSAAKTELCVRAIAGAMGLELPPYRHGVIPDLEAFMTDRQTFSGNYAALLEHS